MKRNRFFVMLVVLAMLSAVTLTPVSAAGSSTVNVQILAVNDFHGAVDPSLTKPSSSDQTTWYYRGGAEYLVNRTYAKDI